MSDEKIKFFIKKEKASLTAPLRGYVSAEAREVIKRLEKVGFDPDLAYEMAASSMPERDFFDLPEEDEK